MHLTKQERNAVASFNELTPNEQERLLAFCSRIHKIKSFNRNHTSYGLKHLYEKIGGYVTNDAFKGAMMQSGFKVRDRNALNFCFNVSQRSINEIRKEIRQKDPRYI